MKKLPKDLPLPFVENHFRCCTQSFICTKCLVQWSEKFSVQVQMYTCSARQAVQCVFNYPKRSGRSLVWCMGLNLLTLVYMRQNSGEGRRWGFWSSNFLWFTGKSLQRPACPVIDQLGDSQEDELDFAEGPGVRM